MNAAVITGLIGAGASLIAIASFFVARMKDAEERGAMKQQIKDLVEQVGELKKTQCVAAERLGGHDTSMAAIGQKIDGLEKLVESISVKLDRLLDRNGAGRDA